jgi:hypothetical protein
VGGGGPPPRPGLRVSGHRPVSATTAPLPSQLARLPEAFWAALDRLPPIVVARGRVLVDGFHRWQAYRREGLAEIPAEDLGNLADAEIVRESISRNASHGQQLSRQDKERLAGRLWQQFAALGNGERTAEIADLLSVSARTVQSWTKDARAAEEREREERAWELWLECWEQSPIADAVGLSQPTISRLIQERKSALMNTAPESRQHFDVWSFGTAKDDDGTGSYFGRMPAQVVENVLWLYTEPGQVVVDPCAGGGTTPDAAE